jgi:hypothetical protein
MDDELGRAILKELRAIAKDVRHIVGMAAFAVGALAVYLLIHSFWSN